MLPLVLNYTSLSQSGGPALSNSPALNFTVIPVLCVSMAMLIKVNKETLKLGGKSMSVSVEQKLGAVETTSVYSSVTVAPSSCSLLQ